MNGIANAQFDSLVVDACRVKPNPKAEQMVYNKDQWISSFEDVILRLRPHLTARILQTITLMAWHRYGAKGQDPTSAATEWSTSMDA